MASAHHSPAILVINTGSSSLKFGLYSAPPSGVEALLHGHAERAGAAGEAGVFTVENAQHVECVSEPIAFESAADPLRRIGTLIADRGLAAPSAIGHRIVHGGPQLHSHCVIDAAVLRRLEAATGFAPLHMPAALAALRTTQSVFPDALQVACLDTAFHANLPEVARVLPFPRALQDEGLRRYGFHGIACESIITRLGKDLPQRMVIAHLGGGASVTAVASGRSVDTSMGLTPAGGMVMGTRCGDIDPGALIWLARHKGLGHDELEELANRRAGLLGISGLSGDMRRLRAAEASNDSARLAIQIFCYSARKHIAAMIAALGGIDLLVFTGGIGEHDAATRAEICRELAWAGISLDAQRNHTVTGLISAPGAHCSVRAVPAAEEDEIARHTWRLLSRA